MARLTRFVVWLILIVPMANAYSWTPISPDQTFPLPKQWPPKILPDPNNETSPSTPRDSSSDPQLGWSSPLLVNPTSGAAPYGGAWPIRGTFKKRRRIRYCFATAEMKEKADCTFKAAQKIWGDALGGAASAQSGHNLAFTEVTRLKKPQYCYKQFYMSQWSGNHNRHVAEDVLHIYWKSEEETKGVSSASVGYVPNEKGKPVPGRHTLTISGNADAVTIAHEIGHVLGMFHETERSDRDDYVEFRCIKLRGFSKALLSATKDGTSMQDATQKLCNDVHFAYQHNFESSQFIKGGALGERASVNGDGGFDVHSIMMYPSESFSMSDCGDDVNRCPLVKLKRDNGVKVGVEKIDKVEKPSQRDVGFVKKYYPWGR